MQKNRKLLLPPLILALLLQIPALAQPAPVFSERYTVRIGKERLPLLKDYEEDARHLDRDRNRVLTLSEIGVRAKKMPGGLKVDADDFALGIAHEMTGTVSTYASSYPSVDEVETRMLALVSAHPDTVEIVDLGPTSGGRRIRALRLGRRDGVERPKIAVVAQQHAREWIAHQAALTTVEALLEDPAQVDLLESFEFWVVPLANPDGYAYSRDVDPMWRKNRRERGDEKSPEAVGVDLNRNFPGFFRRENDSPKTSKDDWGASDWDGSNQYRGPEAGSEPETREILGLLDKPGMVGVIDLHGFGCKIVLENEGSRMGDALYVSLAQSMMASLGPEYQSLHYSDLYPVTGHLTGYADGKGIVGVTLEMGTSFQPDPATIGPTAAQGARGVLAFARYLQGALATRVLKVPA